jgi:P-type Ca2+ transporter type 2C
VHVTRDGYRQKVSICDIVVRDVVHLSIGDQVPADGLYIDGYSFLVDESSLSGESDPMHVSAANPFLLGGTKVQDGSARMLVTAVGMRTEWGSLMGTLSQGGEDKAHAPAGGLLHWRMADAHSVLNFFAVAVTIIVVAVPEGLPLAVTLSLPGVRHEEAHARARPRAAPLGVRDHGVGELHLH